MMILKGFVKLHFSQLEAEGKLLLLYNDNIYGVILQFKKHLWIHTGLIIFSHLRMNRHNKMMRPKVSLCMTWKRSSLEKVWFLSTIHECV